MNLSDDLYSLRLEYIPNFFQNPDQHFLGVSRRDQMSDRTWDQVCMLFQDLAYRVCRPYIRKSILKQSCSLFDLPVHFYDQRDQHRNHSAHVGFALSKIPNDHTQQSRTIKTINRLVTQTLFELPCRLKQSSDSELLTRLIGDGIHPDVPTLQDMCIEIAALHVPTAHIKYLPILLQKSIISFQEKDSVTAR